MGLKSFSLRKFFDISTPETVLQGAVKSSVINLIARVLGYAKNVAIAVLLGFSYQTDAFFMALSLIGIFLIFVDVFDSIGVPELVKERIRSEEEFKKLTGFLFSFTAILSILITFLALILKPLILTIPAGFNKDAIFATEISFLLLLPYLFLNFYFHHFGAVLRSQRRFTYYFIGEAIFSFGVFITILSGLLIFKDYKILPISLSLSQLFATTYIIYVGREYIHFRFFIDETSKKFFFNFIKLLGVYGVFHLYILVDRIFAAYLGEKMVSALYYGLFLVSVPSGILKFENIAIISLSETFGSLNKLNFYLKKLFLITLPMVLFLFVFSPIIVKLLFGYGAFLKVDRDLTSTVLRFYALSLPFMFFWPLIYRVFQIKQKLLSIGIVALLGVVINALFNYIFVFLLKLSLIGICLGTFLAYITICTIGYFMLQFHSKNEIKRG